jgi:hypothetical protein
MPKFYDWTQDEVVNAPTSAHGEVVPLANRGVTAQPPRTNAVTGHGLDCQCPRCPGWYAARVQQAEGYAPGAAPAPRTARPLVDQVIPVCILMVTFSLCALVLLPVITPLVAISALSLGLVAVAICTVAVVALSLVLVVRRTSREFTGATRAARGRVIRGKVL